MQSFSRKLQHLSLLTLGCMLLSVFLVACGGDSCSTTTDSAPAPTQAASSNTSQSDSNTSQSNSNTSQSDSSLQTYTGNGFTIGYPKDWKVTENSAKGEVSFEDPTVNFGLTVGVGDADGSDAATRVQTAVEGIKQKLSDQATFQDHTIDPTTTLAGETWNEQAVDATFQTGSPVTMVVMMATHASKNFSITYQGTKDAFDQGNQSYYQPMLQSFTFAS
jgi:hypothetical protein